MDLERTETYIERFAKKQGVSFIRFAEPGIAEFTHGHFFELDDIHHDIDNNIQPYIALHYSHDGRENGSMPSYAEWLKEFLR